MIRLGNIRSLSDFQRNTKSHIRRLKKTGKPEVLTVKGQAELVVQSADAYEQLLEDAELSQTLEVLRKSLAEAEAGESMPAEQFFRQFAARHGLKLRRKR